MKNATTLVIALLILALATFATLFVVTLVNRPAETTTDLSETHTLYPYAGVVCNLDYENDIVTIGNGADTFGWSFYGCEDWELGDLCAVIMDDNGTPDNVYDDIVVQARYSWTVVSH